MEAGGLNRGGSLWLRILSVDFVFCTQSCTDGVRAHWAMTVVVFFGLTACFVCWICLAAASSM